MGSAALRSMCTRDREGYCSIPTCHLHSTRLSSLSPARAAIISSFHLLNTSYVFTHIASLSPVKPMKQTPLFSSFYICYGRDTNVLNNALKVVTNRGSSPGNLTPELVHLKTMSSVIGLPRQWALASSIFMRKMAWVILTTRN